MLDFSGNDGKAKLIAIFYAEKVGDKKILKFLENNSDIQDKDDAIALGKFYWKMLDASAEDKQNGIVVLGETDSLFWMERLMSIIGGYLCNIGYEDEWNKVCDEA